MVTIKIEDDASELNVKNGLSLMTVLIEHKYLVNNPCNGLLTCGKCKVTVLNNIKQEITIEERKHLSEEEIFADVRLSCALSTNENIVIRINHRKEKSNILTYGYIPEFEFDLAVNIKGDNKYGIAVDIGTTTVVASLVDMINGCEIASSSMINPQKKYGLDVLTRISYAMKEKEKGTLNLQSELINCLNDLIQQMISSSGIINSQIIDCVISANTSLLHFLLGEETISLGIAPYEPVFKCSKYTSALELGINIPEDIMIYTLPMVSAYIGGDIVSGCYASNIHRGSKTKLFIDIGTNGEIVLKHNDKLYACSCAAGPALEGMNISGGIRAQDGAVEDIQLTNSETKLITIGNKHAIGICGSGILAAVRESLSHGLINKRGTILKQKDLSSDDYRHIYLDKGPKTISFKDNCQSLVLSQSDFRQVQLAKGAILSGIQVLVNKAGLSYDQIDKVVIAGQFGAHLPIESLVVTGLIPTILKDKISYNGNTSKSGALMCLMSNVVRKEMEALADKIEYFELAKSDNYEKVFAKALLFD